MCIPRHFRTILLSHSLTDSRYAGELNKTIARASKRGEDKNDNDEQKNEDEKMTKKKVQRKQTSDEETKNKEDTMMTYMEGSSET